MASNPETLLRYARWCRITARNGAALTRQSNLRWAAKLEQMAAMMDSGQTDSMLSEAETSRPTAQIVPWPKS